MGWPGCMWPDCRAWPAVGFTGVCAECIRHPERVDMVATQMNRNAARFTERESADHYRVIFLAREPDGACLERAAKILRDGTTTDVREAIDLAAKLYWSTRTKGKE